MQEIFIMLKKVKDFLKLNNINIDKPVVVAVSGGVDSTVLLDVLYKLGYQVILAHVNHHKRVESEEEEKAMEAWAKKLNIPYEVLEYHYDHTDNFHNDSHNARYNFFRDVCKKYNTNIICTAHHLDDQIETILMKLMEGSNLYGYGGISVVNDDGEFQIIRPLLCAAKDEIYEYAKKEKILYFEDSSNQEDLFLRNRLRHNVVPILKEECSDLAMKTLEYSTILKESFNFIRKLSIKYLNDNDSKIVYDTFNDLDIALKKDIICLMLEQNEIRKNNNIIYNVLDLVSSNSGNKQIDLNDDYLFVRNYDKSYVTKATKKDELKYKLDLDDVLEFEEYKIYFSKIKPNNSVKYLKLCYNCLKFPFFIRNKKDGDYIKLKSGNKKISRVFIDNKVPNNRRNEVMIITDGDDNVIWVYDYIKSDLIYAMKGHEDLYLIVEEK